METTCCGQQQGNQSEPLISMKVKLFSRRAKTFAPRLSSTSGCIYSEGFHPRTGPFCRTLTPSDFLSDTQTQVNTPRQLMTHVRPREHEASSAGRRELQHLHWLRDVDGHFHIAGSGYDGAAAAVTANAHRSNQSAGQALIDLPNEKIYPSWS